MVRIERVVINIGIRKVDIIGILQDINRVGIEIDMIGAIKRGTNFPMINLEDIIQVVLVHLTPLDHPVLAPIQVVLLHLLVKKEEEIITKIIKIRNMEVEINKSTLTKLMIIGKNTHTLREGDQEWKKEPNFIGMVSNGSLGPSLFMTLTKMLLQ